MKRKQIIWSIGIAAVLLIISIILYINLQPKPKDEPVISSNTIKIKSDVTYFEKEDSETLEKKIVHAEVADENTVKLTFDTIPDAFEDLKEEDIFILEQTESNPLGYIGRIKTITNENDQYVYEIEQPLIEDVFSDIKFKKKTAFDADNVLLTEVYDNGIDYMYCTSDNSKTYNEEAVKVTFTDDSIHLNITDLILYDHDKNVDTLNDQVYLNGEVALDEIIFDTAVDYNSIIDWNQLKLKLSCNKTADVNVGATFKNIDLVNKDENKNFNRYDIGFFFRDIVVEGIDYTDDIVLCTLLYDLGTSTMYLQNGPPKKVPAAIVIMITANIEGEINATASLGLHYENLFEKGLNYHKNNIKVEEGVKTINKGDYALELYDSSMKEDNHTLEMYADVKGEVNTKFSVGPDLGMMILGLNISSLKTHLSLNSNAAMEGRVSFDGQDIDTEGSVELATSLNIDITARARIKGAFKEKEKSELAFNLKKTEDKEEDKEEKEFYKIGFELPMSLVLWEKEFVFNEKDDDTKDKKDDIASSEANQEKLTKEREIDALIPNGWHIFENMSNEPVLVEGDLNKDEMNDIAFIIEQVSGDIAPERALVIGFGNKDGTYTLSTIADNVILRADEGGVWGDPFEGISINRGSILINHYGGSNWRWYDSYRWRYQDNDWYLIGATIGSYFTGNSLEDEEVEYNLLTGDYIEKKADENGDIQTTRGNRGKRELIKIEEFGLISFLDPDKESDTTNQGYLKFEVEGKTFIITNYTYSYTEDHDAIVKNLYGDEYRIADFQDILELNNVNDFVNNIDLGVYYFVNNNGEKYYSQTRKYFITRFDHNKPSNYLAHKTIDNDLLCLGSWSSECKILVIKDDKPISNNREDLLTYYLSYKGKKPHDVKDIYGDIHYGDYEGIPVLSYDNEAFFFVSPSGTWSEDTKDLEAGYVWYWGEEKIGDVYIGMSSEEVKKAWPNYYEYQDELDGTNQISCSFGNYGLDVTIDSATNTVNRIAIYYPE